MNLARKTLLATMLIGSMTAATGIQAASVVDTSGVIVGGDDGFGTAKEVFNITDPGLYTLTLTDLGALSSEDFLEPFEQLGLVLLKGHELIGTLFFDGDASGSFIFDATQGGYRAQLFGEVEADPFPVGMFGLEVAPVPLPASILMLGSALVGLCMVGRREKALPPAA